MNVPSWVLIAASTIMWGTWGVCNKVALRGLTPIQVEIVSSFITAALVPLFFWMARSSGRPLVWEPRCVMWAAIASLTTVFAALFCMMAMRDRGATSVVGMTAAYPAVTLVLSALFLGERPTLSCYIGILSVQFGVWLISR